MWAVWWPSSCSALRPVPEPVICFINITVTLKLLPFLFWRTPSRWRHVSPHWAPPAPVSVKWVFSVWPLGWVTVLSSACPLSFSSIFMLYFPFALSLRVSSFPAVIIAVPLPWAFVTIWPTVTGLKPVWVHYHTATPAAQEMSDCKGGNKFYKSSWGKENYRKEQTLDYINDLLINTSIWYPPYLISSIILCKFSSKLWISAVLTFHRKKTVKIVKFGLVFT